MPSELEILTAIRDIMVIESLNGIDPLHYAAIYGIELEGKSPVLWAVENNKKIDNKDPLLYALLNEGFDVNKNVLEAVPEGYQINVSAEVFSVSPTNESKIRRMKVVFLIMVLLKIKREYFAQRYEL